MTVDARGKSGQGGQIGTKSTPLPRPVTDLSLEGPGSSDLLRTTFIFASGSYSARLLGLVSGLLTSRLVDPAVLGLYNSIGLVQGYAPLLQVGVDNGLRRELPFEIGRGSEGEAQLLAAAAQAWSLSVAGVASFFLFVIALWNAAYARWDLAAGWVSFAVVVFWVLYGQGYLQSLYRTGGHFARLARITFAQGLAGLVLVGAVWLFGFYGLCIRGLGMAMGALFLTWIWRPISVAPRWDKGRFQKLLRVGLPIFAVGHLSALWVVLNNSAVFALMGKEALGLFAIANLVSGTVNLVPQALSNVIYPRMCEVYGRTGSVGATLGIVPGPLAVAVGITAVAVGSAWLLLPPFVTLVLPKYTGGIAAAQWTATIALVLSLMPVSNIFNVAQKQGRYAAALLAGLATNAVVLGVLVSVRSDLANFPQAMLVGRGVTTVMCLAMVWQLARSEGRDGAPR